MKPGISYVTCHSLPNDAGIFIFPNWLSGFSIPSIPAHCSYVDIRVRARQQKQRHQVHGAGTVSNLPSLVMLHAVFLALPLLAGVAAANEADKPKRNVLYIVYDDLRPDLSLYNLSFMRTPNLQKLADTGTTFDRAYCQQTVGLVLMFMLDPLVDSPANTLICRCVHHLVCHLQRGVGPIRLVPGTFSTTFARLSVPARHGARL